MGLYQDYDADMKAEVSFGESVLTLLSDLHPRMRAVSQRLQKKYRHNLAGDVSDQVATAIELEKVAVAVADWRGVTGPDGAELPFTQENVRKVMTDLPWLRKDVLYAVLVKETFRKEAQAALGEASAPSSDPT